MGHTQQRLRQRIRPLFGDNCTYNRTNTPAPSPIPQHIPRHTHTTAQIPLNLHHHPHQSGSVPWSPQPSCIVASANLKHKVHAARKEQPQETKHSNKKSCKNDATKLGIKLKGHTLCQDRSKQLVCSMAIPVTWTNNAIGNNARRNFRYASCAAPKTNSDASRSVEHLVDREFHVASRSTVHCDVNCDVNCGWVAVASDVADGVGVLLQHRLERQATPLTAKHSPFITTSAPHTHSRALVP